MGIEYQIQEFKPKSSNRDLIDNYIEFQQKIFSIENPDDPPTPKDVRESNLLNPSPHADYYRWVVITQNNELIASASLAVMNQNSPDYDQNKEYAFVNANVLDPYGNQGIGTKLTRAILEKAKKLDKSTLVVSTTQNSGHQFLSKFGATIALEGAENRLYMEDVNWGMIEEWAEEGPSRAQGVKIANFTEVPEEIIDQFVEIYSETMNQQPMGDLDVKIKVTPESRRQQEELFASRGYEWVTKITIEENGDISGLTEIFINPKIPHRIDQNLTGVNERYRGKGLGKWLKAEMLLDIKRTFPDLKYISTGNADSNAPMLSINQRMGFKRYKTGNTYKASVLELEKRLNL